MKRLFPFICLACLMPQSACGQEISGSWKGKLSLGMTELNIVFHIQKNGDSTVCKMESPDQGAKDIDTKVDYISADSLRLSVPSLGAAYSGHLADGTIKGEFAQAGYRFPLSLKQGTVIQNRPQTPIPPYPYTSKEVTFINPDDGAVLSGTITYPAGYGKNKKKAPMPVVLMVTGSGLQDRNEEVFGHKPFLVMADFLARNGIASLRYDDRGFGKSTGDVRKATTVTFKNDAKAGLCFLRQLNEFDKIGVLGHSEGGTISFILGAEGITDFVISMAGTAVRGDKIIIEQNRAALTLAGMQEEAVQAYCKTLEKVYEHKVHDKEQGTPEIILEQILKDNNISLQETAKANVLRIMTMDNAWMSHFLSYNPAEDIRSISCPVLAINGDLDTQVLSKINLPEIKRLLPEGKHNIVKEYHGLNHPFQHATTGAVTEYAKLEETISEEVMKDIADWINSLD
ncbi:MAG: alpha/beta hydrolase [Bacteroidales bacterium]|nr:alpha/beta hydrolase [Bacteroidales bacterium]MCM1148067.1 alpha/beta hydrolase [Bacteroidales bacterium]MCM1207162.1 alpha/beta hydrolase [Bacillota bacterium]MCM1509478.1 alpha/beta hydrolase [Clostridium sp.]